MPLNQKGEAIPVPRVIVFTDFDGTITLQDTGTILIDKCMGHENRRKLDFQVMAATMTPRDALLVMWGSVDLTWEEAMHLLKDVKFDLDLHLFVQFCLKHSVPVTVLSSGLVPLVEDFLKRALAEDTDRIEVFANNVVLTDRKWEIKFIDDSKYGHDKSLIINKTKAKLGRDMSLPAHTLEPSELLKSSANHATLPRPIVVFCGDGVSDISAAREADILFARRGLDLHNWCLKEGVAHTAFDRFGEVLDVVKAIVLGVEGTRL